MNKEQNQNSFKPKRFLRLPDVLSRYPVSRSHWYEGVRTGRYPKPYRLSNCITAWLESDIDQLIESLEVSL